MARKNYVPVRLNDDELQKLEVLVNKLSVFKELTKADVIRYAIDELSKKHITENTTQNTQNNE